MSRAEQLFKRSLDDPYNEVSILPTEGGITILLSHRITMDAAAWSLFRTTTSCSSTEMRIKRSWKASIQA